MARQVAIEIFSPTEGLHQELPSTMLTPRSTPFVRDCNSYFGVAQKDYGTSLFCTASLGAPMNMIYEANFQAQSVLETFTHTGMYKYTSTGLANDGQTYTGTFTDNWSACMHNNAMIYSNGKDLVQYKPTYSATGTVMGGIATGSYLARAVVSFKDHVNLYHLTESGNVSSKRVRWSKVGLMTYTMSDWSTAGSGFLDLQDADGSILNAEKLGDGSVAIYADNSVHIQEWVGGTGIYRFTKTISNTDIPTRRCVAGKESLHYVLTRQGVFEYPGGRSWKEISAPIREDFISVFNNTHMDKAFIQYVRADDELRLYVPTGTSTQPDVCYICKLRDDYAWFRDVRGATTHGKFTTPSAITIGDLVGDIGAQNWKFGDQAVRAGAPIPLLGDANGNLLKMDKTVYSIVSSATSTAQQFVFDTKNFTSMQDVDPLTKNKYDATIYMDSEVRWLRITVEAKGNGDINALYSLDGGQSYTTCPEGAKTLTSSWQMFYWDIDVCSVSLQGRITNSGLNESIHIRYIKAEFVPISGGGTYG